MKTFYRCLLLLAAFLVFATMCLFNAHFNQSFSDAVVSISDRIVNEIDHLEWRKAVRKRLAMRLPFRNNLILFYTNYFGSKPWIRRFGRIDRNCEVKQECEFTYDKERFVESHAVLFHAPDMPTVEELQMLSRYARRRKQVWVYFTMENPTNSYFNPELEQFFNLSMSYRLDSDLHIPYARHEKKEISYAKTRTINYASNKTRQTAWLVSNCGQLRDKLVGKLEDLEISVDMGGACQEDEDWALECEGEMCEKTLKKYKFYLALENNFCRDYITEKYWYYPFENNMIPIVLGGADYNNPLLAIPRSFINVFDFKSPMDLVKHIRELDSNDKLFNTYFEWKRQWRLSSTMLQCDPALLKLCAMLSKPLPPRKMSFEKEFGNKRECHQKSMLFKMWLVKQ